MAAASGVASKTSGILARIVEHASGHSGSRLAVFCPEDESLTYGCMLERARGLAAELRKWSTRSRAEGTPLVLLRCGRTASLVVGILGVWCSKGAYVPVDPEHPPARQELIARQSGATVAVIAVDSLDERVDLGPTVKVAVLLDRRGIVLGSRTVASGAQDDMSAFPVPPGLAYVMFTSGSTGLPKGVMVGAVGLEMVLGALQTMLQMDSSDNCLAVTTFSFDISVLELILPLISGGCVVLAPTSTTRSGASLAGMLTVAGQPSSETPLVSSGGWLQPPITLMQATPATWRMVVHAGWAGNPRLRVLCGGEAFPAPTLMPLVVTCRSVINLYGPTEATVWCTAHLIGRDSFSASSRWGVPIGCPLAYDGCKCEVMAQSEGDGAWLPVADGVEGELWVAGPALALGYLGDPALTASRFCTTQALDLGTTWYRTGDIAVRGTHELGGLLYFVRRQDEQVKVAGHRVEVGDVEAAIRGTAFAPLPWRVSDVAVVSAPHVTGSGAESFSGMHVLVAFVVLTRSSKLSDRGKDEAGDYGFQQTRSILRRNATTALPAYMVPRRWVVMDHGNVSDHSKWASSGSSKMKSLPLNANGKVDRHALVDRATTLLRFSSSEQCELRLTSDLTQTQLGIYLREVVKEAIRMATFEDTTDDYDSSNNFPIDDDTNLAAQGITSIGVVSFASILGTMLGGLEVPATAPILHPTVSAFAAYLQRDRNVTASDIRVDMVPSLRREVEGRAMLSTSSLGGQKKPSRARGKQKAADQDCAKKRGAGQPDAGLEACREGDLGSVLALMKGEVEGLGVWDVETVDRFGSPGLHWAASGGHLQVCKALVDAGGADVKKRDKKSGRSAMHWAARQGQVEVARWLVDEKGLIADDLTKVRTPVVRVV